MQTMLLICYQLMFAEKTQNYLVSASVTLKTASYRRYNYTFIYSSWDRI